MLTSDEPLPNLLFEYRGADIILHSHDSHNFRVPKSYIVNTSPVLEQLIQRVLDPPDEIHGEASLPVVQLPESGAILHSLLTFIFPVTPLVPSTTEKAMELLSVAQKYQMDSVLAHIRLSLERQNPSSTNRDTAFHSYSLAQKYGLHQEALQAARTILNYPMNIEDLEDQLDIVQGASLHELWKYNEKVRSILASDLNEFRMSSARGTLTGLNCVELSTSGIPCWLDDYIGSIGDAINLFDFIEFNTAMARHTEAESGNSGCKCVLMPGQTIRNFWEALSSVIDGIFEKVHKIDVDELLTRLTSLQAESALSLVKERDDSQTKVNPTTLLSQPLDIPDANIIIRSSDLVNFRVHKSVLAMTSPVFSELLSLPQPSDSESIDGLPVVQLSEDAELLNSLVSILYPVWLVIPNSYEKVLYLLAACQKYEMVQVQSFIHAEVNRGSFPAPVGTEAFRAYAIASSKGLIPEMKRTARLTLDHPMTFETLGEALRLFDGCALRDLIRFRKRCRDNLVKCLESFLKVHAPGPSSIWVGCPSVMPTRHDMGLFSTRRPDDMWNMPGPVVLHQVQQPRVLPSWLCQLLSQNNDLKLQAFTQPLIIPSNIRGEYLTALQSHSGCGFCFRVHGMKGSTFCAELESKLAEARDMV